MAIASIDPRTGETRQTFERLTDAEVDRKLEAAHRAFQSWRRTSFATRSQPMLRAAEILEAEKQTLGRMMTEEMGKTLTSAIAEAEKCALGCRYYAEHAEAALADETIATERATELRALPAAWGSFSRSCPGTSRSGRCFASSRRRSWPGTSACSSTRRTCRAARSPSRTCFVARGLSRRSLPDAPHRRCGGAARAGRSAGRRRDADRQRTGRRGRRVAVREAHQTDCARARRQRSVHRHALGQSRHGGAYGA